jgi:hypothetical protein
MTWGVLSLLRVCLVKPLFNVDPREWECRFAEHAEKRQVHIGLHFHQIFEQETPAQDDGGLETIYFMRIKRT